MPNIRSDNAPTLEVGLVVGRVHQDGSRVARLWYRQPDGVTVWLTPRQWASGRPDPIQVDDIVTGLADLAAQQLVDRLGVQGVLGGS